MCLKPGQEGHLPLAKTRKVHITQTEGVEFDRYVNAIVEYKNEWEKNNPGRKWTGNVPRRYSVELENDTLVNIGRWVQLQKQKNVEGSLEKILRSTGCCPNLVFWTSQATLDRVCVFVVAKATFLSASKKLVSVFKES